jgi:valyl-tRNA synthetase
MPFITEELWQKTAEIGPARETLLIEAPWPRFKGLGDARADAELQWVIRMISEVRSVRAEMNVPASAKLSCIIVGARAESRRIASSWANEITRLARLENIAFSERVPDGAAQLVLGEAIVALPLAGVIDLAAERARLEREREQIDADVALIARRLSNDGFISKAPEQVLEETRERRTALEARSMKITEALRRLPG